MPLPNADTKILETGAFLKLFIVQRGVRSILGLVNQFSFNEDFQVNQADVIGFFGPISIDAQGYRCSITIGTYIPPNPRANITEPFPDGGEITIDKVLKTRTQIALDGKGSMIDQMDTVNPVSGVVVNSFKNVVITTNGAQISPNTYVTRNMQCLAMDRLQ